MKSVLAHARGLFRTLIVAALIGVGLMSQPVHADDDADYVPNEIVVKLFQAPDLTSVATSYGLDPTPLDQFGARPIFRLRIADGSTPPDKAAALSADPRVRYAEPNFIAQAPEGRQRSLWVKVDGTGYGSQWAAEHIGLPQAHTVTRGAGIVVAVLDTGVDAGHPALAGRMQPGYDFVDMDADPSEVGVAGQDAAFGHGTHVAGIIAYTAPEASILPVRVLDRNGMGNMWVLAEALAYAVNPDGNPATDDGAQVINLSLSTLRRTDLIKDIVASVTCDDDDDNDANDDRDDDERDDDQNSDDAHDDDDDCLAYDRRGAVVIAAAGNSASSTPEYPAAEGQPGLIAVGASTRQDTLAAFSNYGAWVHVSGPGQDIVSAVPGGEYATWNGTSMAAPFVAGQAALIRAFFPTFTPADVANRIRTTAQPIGGPVPLRIDVAASLGASSVNNAGQRIAYLPLIRSSRT